MTHAVVGPDLVRPFVNEEVVEIISHHHDHYDGGSIDQSVKGKDIPLGARIVAVADAFNAMISDRPYREAMTEKAAPLRKLTGLAVLNSILLWLTH